MICFPNAKINIGLNITEKRADGFHNIATVMYPLKGIVYDALEIIRLIPDPSPKEKGKNTAELISSGISIPGNSNDNLCVKACHLIKKKYPFPPIKIHLHKAIPTGAGLGGGSANAAFLIRLLNDTFELGISWGEMHYYARQLGSDCSFFISNKPAFAEGKGDEFESVKLNLSNYHIALIYPDIHISTAEAYSMVKPSPISKGRDTMASFRAGGKLPVENWEDTIVNDFEEPVFKIYPRLKKIKQKLYSLGAVYASMSGSGSAVYGIFSKEPKVKKHFSTQGGSASGGKNYRIWEGRLQ